MILPAILCTFKGKLFLGMAAIFATVAVTEAFLGNLIIAIVASVIGASPATAAIIIMSRKQSAERRAQNKELLEGQKEMAENLDGKLDRLSKAETGQAKAEGIIEGGDKEQARAAAMPAAAEAIPVIVENPPEKPANVRQAPSD